MNDHNAFVSDRDEIASLCQALNPELARLALCSALYVYFSGTEGFFYLPKQKSDTKDKTCETYWSNSDSIFLTIASNRASLCGTYWANQYQHIPMDSTTEFMAFSVNLHQYIKETRRGRPLFSHFFLLLLSSFPLPIYGMTDPSGLLFSLLQVRLFNLVKLTRVRNSIKSTFCIRAAIFSSKGFPDRLHSPLKTCFISSCLLCEPKANGAAGCRENETHPI